MTMPPFLAPKPSLRSRIAWHVLAPLVLTWALGTVGALWVAQYFAGTAFDRSLLDDAYAVASNVRGTADALSLDLSPNEVGTLLFDQTEQMYFAVLLPEGALLAGHAGLRPSAAPGAASGGGAFEFSDIYFQGRALRAVTLRRNQPAAFTVVMAQTSNSRNRMLHTLLVYSVVPQVLLLVLLAFWLRRVIQNDLKPLTALQRSLDLRTASDLTPVASDLAEHANTRDVQHLGVAVNAMLDRLGSSLTAQREFAGNIAHELRTPLAAIRAQADYALTHAEPAVWHQQLSRIAQGEQRASHLIDQLLALALADEARTSLTLEPVALNELARDVLLRFLPKADAAGVDLGGEGLDDTVMVQANTALLEGLLGNLLGNALRYGTADQPCVTVSVSVQDEAQGRFAMLSVIDNGPGLPQAASQNLLQRWVRGKASESPNAAQSASAAAGVGLGLAIVGRYAELLGARVTFAPAESGQGLKASVVFPRRQ